MLYRENRMEIEERLNMGGGGVTIFVPTSQFGCFCQCLWFQGEADQLELRPGGGRLDLCRLGGWGGAGRGEGPGQVQEGTESVTSAIIRC